MLENFNGSRLRSALCEKMPREVCSGLDCDRCDAVSQVIVKTMFNRGYKKVNPEAEELARLRSIVEADGWCVHCGLPVSDEEDNNHWKTCAYHPANQVINTLTEERDAYKKALEMIARDGQWTCTTPRDMLAWCGCTAREVLKRFSK